jgi:hypothetical protein
MPTYQVFRLGGTAQPVAIFATAADASAFIANAGAVSPQKYRIHFECTHDEIWQAHFREDRRMQQEFQDIQYIPVPDWFPASECPFNHHLHFAVDETRRRQGWVAYTPDVRHLVEDKQLTLPASKYLAKFFPDIPANEIAKLHIKLQSVFAPTEFAVTQDKAILHKAFIGTKHCAESSDYESCMRYTADEYRLPEGQHPIDAYFFDNPTDSDFALAYTTRDNEIVARAMVVPALKIFVRVYGNSEIERQDILNHLKAAGYKRAKSFNGARLCLRPHPRSPDGLPIMPYIDGSIQTCNKNGVITNDDDWFYDCETTEGFARSRDNEDATLDEEDEDEDPEEATFYCDRTETTYSYAQENTQTVVIPELDNIQNIAAIEIWCWRLTRHLLVYCAAANNGCGAWVPADHPTYLAWLAVQPTTSNPAVTADMESTL